MDQDTRNRLEVERAEKLARHLELADRCAEQGREHDPRAAARRLCVRHQFSGGLRCRRCGRDRYAEGR